MAVLIETSIGDLVIDLYIKERPKACLNFLKLCKIKFYNYCLFYNIQSNFIAQTGDPSGTGEGGQSIWGVINGEEQRYVENEVIPRLKHSKTGTVSMISNDNDCHTSQFFLTLRENLHYLDGKHCVFGEVAEGFDVLEKLSIVSVDKRSRPLQDVRIFHTVVLEDPYEDPPSLVIPDRSPSPPPDLSDANHIGVDEDIDEFEGMTVAEVQEAITTRESKANAHILEMVGDIPDADAKPPENILFVCKLNPATSSEDLEIIFSRFGRIVSCEVIRDQKSGDSLQYAFIEFENEDDCIKAYFKMDNVLIDDRRIHVDFSQSLAKTQYRKLTSGPPVTDDKYEMVFDDNELVSAEEKKGKQSERMKEGDHHLMHSNRRASHNKGRVRERSRERHERSSGRHDRSERRHERSKERSSGRRERSREKNSFSKHENKFR